MSLRDPIVVLEDMLEAVQSIEEYSTNLSFDVYDADKKTKDAVVRNFEILGEAATHITDEVRVRFPDIPWNRVIGLRNIIIHRYFGVDHENGLVHHQRTTPLPENAHRSSPP